MCNMAAAFGAAHGRGRRVCGTAVAVEGMKANILFHNHNCKLIMGTIDSEERCDSAKG